MKTFYELKVRIADQKGAVKYRPDFTCNGKGCGFTVMTQRVITNESHLLDGENVGGAGVAVAPAASASDDDDDSGDDPDRPPKKKAAPAGTGAALKEKLSSQNNTIGDCLREVQEGQDNDCPTAVDQPPNAALFASAYAFIGLRPIALRQNSKIPSIGGWQDTPALTPDQVAVKFQNHSGNLGCTFPTNLFALDVDCKEGAQGYESLSALEDVHGPLPVTLTQRTPSGGEHRLFKKHASIIIDNKTGFLPGLDIRATGGQIAVEPSTIKGKPYCWIDWSPSDGEIPTIADAPQWLVDVIQKKGAHSAPGDQGGKSGTTPTTEIWVPPHVLADLASALEYINPDSYASWINVGQQLRELGEPGFRLWDEWAQKSDKYEQGEMRRKWRTFTHERTGYKAVFTEAQKAGWPNPLSNVAGGAKKGRSFGPNADAPPEQQGAPEAEAVPTYTRKQIELLIDATDDFDELTGTIAQMIRAAHGLNETEMLRLRKFIAKKASVSVSSLKEDANLYDKVQPDKDFDHLKAARETLKAYGQGNMIEALSALWRYRGTGVWKQIDDREVKGKIHDVAESSALTASVVTSVLDMLKTEAHRPGHQFDVRTDNINTISGMLRYSAGKWVVLPHDREIYSTAQIPVKYDPTATAPRFEQFLREVFAGTKDAEERIAVVCEALGYSMTTSTRLEKFFMLIGKGANGKSVLLAVLTALLGRDQTSAIQPSQFENQFQRAHLHGKLANIVTEIAEGAEIADAQLKSLVSGEMTTAEHKFKSPFEFVPVAKHWFGTNHMPHTRDFSDALFRRATILEFPNKFDGDKCDVHLGEKLTAELPGILNLALAGLGRLTERRAFTSCASSVDMAKKWRVEADQVAQFVDECCAPVAGAAIESAALYHKYDEWADGEGIHRKLNRKNFTTRLENQGFHAGKGTGGKRMIYGILLQSVY